MSRCVQPNDVNVNRIQRLMTFAKRLRAARKRLALDQEGFGAVGGVSRGAQSNYEKGERSPDVDYLLRIGEAGVDICELLTGIPTETPAFDASEIEIVALLRSSSPDVRAAIATILRSRGPQVSISSGATLHSDATSFAQDGDKR